MPSKGGDWALERPVADGAARAATQQGRAPSERKKAMYLCMRRKSRLRRVRRRPAALSSTVAFLR
eukprot:4801762-Lingulodinium_polyedra.AAC.1